MLFISLKFSRQLVDTIFNPQELDQHNKQSEQQQKKSRWGGLRILRVAEVGELVCDASLCIFLMVLL